MPVCCARAVPTRSGRQRPDAGGQWEISIVVTGQARSRAGSGLTQGVTAVAESGPVQAVSPSKNRSHQGMASVLIGMLRTIGLEFHARFGDRFGEVS